MTLLTHHGFRSSYSRASWNEGTPIRTQLSDATQAENCRIKVPAQASAQSVMQQHGTSVHFARFEAFVRLCRVEPSQSYGRHGLAVVLSLEPGQDDGLVLMDVLHGTQPA